MIKVHVPSEFNTYKLLIQLKHLPFVGSNVPQVDDTLKQVLLVLYCLGPQSTCLL